MVHDVRSFNPGDLVCGKRSYAGLCFVRILELGDEKRDGGLARLFVGRSAQIGTLSAGLLY